MSIRKRRSRARRARTLRKALNIAAIAILALGVLGITLTIAFDSETNARHNNTFDTWPVL